MSHKLSIKELQLVPMTEKNLEHPKIEPMIINNNLSKNIDQSLLEELEQRRIKAEKKLNIFTLITLVISIVAFFYNINEANDSEEAFGILFIIGVIGFMVFTIGSKLITLEYIKEFKLKIIKPLIESIDKTISYHPDRNIPRFIFKKSKLFGMFNKYSGDDFVSGEIDGVQFSLSELSVFDEKNAGKNNKILIKIFQGIFCEFNFNKNFSSLLLIYPDVAEKYFGHFGQWLQSMNMTKDQLIKLDNPEFEKHFVVYGNDQIEARYLLTHSMMAYILKLREELNAPIYISFNESKLYIGIDYDGVEQFEPDISTSLLNSSYIHQHIQKISYHIEIIKNFKLNQFLWSKQPENKHSLELKSDIQTKINEKLIFEENNEDQNKVSAQETYDEFFKQATEISKSLNQQRKKVLIYKTIFTIFIIFLYIKWSISIYGTTHNDIVIISFLGLFTWFAILFGNASIESNYSDNYKTNLIKTLFKYINSNLLYQPDYHISQNKIYDAMLFKDWSNFTGDDLIEGKISNLNTLGSELNIELKDSKIFQGYFFIVDLEKYDNLDLRIFPSTNTFGVEGIDNITVLNNMPKRSYQYFLKIFSIYGNNKDAQRILSKKFISRLLYFYKELSVNKIFVSFQGSKLYIGFDFNGEEFFNAPVFKNICNKDDFLFYIDFFNALEELISSIDIS
jgi:hypothetical protein